MAKGLLIMLVVFLIVAILGWGLSKIGNAPEEKKKRYRKYLAIFNGLFLIIQGSLGLWEPTKFDWVYALLILLGLVFLWPGITGKFDTSAKASS